jgi:hypothetical protein
MNIEVGTRFPKNRASFGLWLYPSQGMHLVFHPRQRSRSRAMTSFQSIKFLFSLIKRHDIADRLAISRSQKWIYLNFLSGLRSPYR